MQSKYKWVYIIAVVIVFLLLAAKAYYDTNSVEIKRYEIENLPLGEVLTGLKAAVISDLHMRRIGPRESKVLEIVSEENPDLIFIIGDFIHFGGSYKPALSFFHQLKPPFGVYAVLGNTEYSNENESCILCHKEKSNSLKESQNPYFLRNSSVRLKINGRILNIVGVDDPVEKRSDLKTALRRIDPGSPSLLLAHSPEIFEEASSCGIHLLLCGHTHGGQLFITRYLRKILPLESALEFLEGFFQKGRTLLYVSRGLGTSFLPFRFGVKPEISFFIFNKTSAGDPTKNFVISNTPPTIIFAGLSISNLFETFDLFGIFRDRFVARHPGNSNILFDFESESDLKRLNWECHKWFELSDNHVTSGRHSLKISLPPGRYPGVDFKEIRNDWSEFRHLRMDVFNPADEKFKFHVRIDDKESGVKYSERFDMHFDMKPGMNHISIPTDSIRTNMHSRPLRLNHIKRMMVFVGDNTRRRDIYIDHIRLE